jgi:hypothetical protein
MAAPVHKVGIVVDRSFGPRISAVAGQLHLWVVDSAENAAAIRDVWAKQDPGDQSDPLGTGVTSFAADVSEPAETMCIRLAEVVDEHHGEYAHDPPWSEISVFGVPLSAELREAFARLGGTAFYPTAEGGVCRR